MNEKTSSRAVIAISPDISEDLRELSANSGLSASFIARVGLRIMLDRLKSGRAHIINGSYVETNEEAA